MSDASAARRRRRRTILRWTLTTVVVGVVGYFFATTLAANWTEVVEQGLEFSWLWVAATALFALAVPFTGLLWARILRWLEPTARVSAREATAVQAASWLLKYVPGQVGSVVNKVLWGGRKSISRMLIVISFVYENVFLQLASIAPSAIILLVSLGPEIFGRNFTLLLLPVLILVPLALVAWKPLFHRAVNFAARRALKQEVPERYFLSTPRALVSAFEFIGPRVLNGIGFVLIAASVAEITPAEWLPFAAAYVLAGAIGILAVFVPSGIGVREAVIVLILGQYIPTTEAIVIALLARLLSTLADALIALYYAAVRRTIPKEIRP
ncbi:lysylphosphatidylglycerol synthase domain-containing protein [Agromyces sp. SYSU T0242]|uniref:lysylphosphatidylglycerol synthase domain-containing protein n=1 Tax=Agromyces litoreus TaxID=3158561 RepID=UPI003392A6FE